ncbi:hypothetical protein [Legionella shakespearei]|uniref:Uncharacterized protein n=1 Tax=Legionella shakespearei DSM 23087 TaxID=1122169 RepID=A0A0W0YT28_9GAMM|nr:hypothetical protein [Legionella shakespearei]KTD60029.1 hypothetical protein Lsha_1779 [Legionella shakespearei DSM 23087]
MLPDLAPTNLAISTTTNSVAPTIPEPFIVISNLIGHMHKEYQSRIMTEIINRNVMAIAEEYAQRKSIECAERYIDALDKALVELNFIMAELDSDLINQYIKQIREKKIQLVLDIDKLNIAFMPSSYFRNISIGNMKDYLDRIEIRRRPNVFSIKMTDSGYFELFPPETFEYEVINYMNELIPIETKPFFMNLYLVGYPYLLTTRHERFSQATKEFSIFCTCIKNQEQPQSDLKTTIFIINHHGQIFRFPQSLQIFSGISIQSREYLKTLYQVSDVLKNSAHQYSAEEFAAFSFVLNHDLIPDAMQERVAMLRQNVQHNLEDKTKAEQALKIYAEEAEVFIAYLSTLTDYDDFYKIKMQSVKEELRCSFKSYDEYYSCALPEEHSFGFFSKVLTFFSKSSFSSRQEVSCNNPSITKM